jgi:hypothetical protein
LTRPTLINERLIVWLLVLAYLIHSTNQAEAVGVLVNRLFLCVTIKKAVTFPVTSIINFKKYSKYAAFKA